MNDNITKPSSGSHPPRLASLTSAPRSSRISRSLVWRTDEHDELALPVTLYRFMRDSVPAISSCIWTWSRLVAAPSRYSISDETPATRHPRAEKILRDLAQRLFPFRFRRLGGLSGFMPVLTETLFTDGAFAGFVELAADSSRVERIIPVDITRIRSRPSNNGPLLFLDTPDGPLSLDRPDFLYFGLNSDLHSGLGRSILSSIPFVAFVERQLVDDMRRASHNAGFHRLHVKVTPPERQSGESEQMYTDRANEYFDKTAELIRDLRTEDNPITWSDIAIEYIGPNRSRGGAESWFINHRAVIEEICAGANLSPFLLGYSFGATESWSGFKYDLVMRQVVTVQEELARIMEWLGNLELALAGINAVCRFEFDNHASFTAPDSAKAQATAVDSLVKLFNAGLLDADDAKRQARHLASRDGWL